MATMPTRRMRLPAPAKRRLNHWVNALSGCKRSQLQASSISIVRARLLPALLMPCSIWLSPLAYGVGARPTQPASSRRLAKRRQPSFNEQFYGFGSFNELLEEAQARGQLDLEMDERSGGYVIRTGPDDN